MSDELHEKTIEATAKLLQETAVDVAWRQWARLGAGAVTTPQGHGVSIMDPEALLLLSLTVQDAERRLATFLGWWARVGSQLLSVQRTKTLLKHFPEPAAHGMSEFARVALEAGDRRWRRYASDELPYWASSRLKGTETPRLSEAATLTLRLRAGFGVNAKADALSFLLGITGESATVQDIAGAIGYSKVAVRNALKDMVLARLIHEMPDHPARYFVRLEPWAALLELVESGDTRTPVWTYWYAIEAFLAHSYELFKQASADRMSPYVVSSRARELVDAFGSAFSKNRIPIPRPADYRGTAYLAAFHETVRSLRAWTLSHL